MKLTRWFTTNLLLLLLVLYNFVPNVYGAEPIDEVREYVKNYYVDNVDKEILHLPTIKDMLSKLDPYSTYFTEEEFQKFFNAINHNYVGVGIGLDQKEDQTIVSTVYPNSPAERTGVKEGDILLSVNGKKTIGLSLEDIAALLHGEEGTSFSLELARLNDTVTVLLRRELITIPTVYAESLAGNAGYIYIASFNDETTPELQRIVTNMPHIQHWIIDLRDNPGGYVDSALEMLGMFPSVKTAVIVKSRGNTEAYEAIPQTKKFLSRVSLLVNENSASASEIVAGTLKATNSAILYGEKTYGKGLMQTLFELKSGGVLKLTTHRFFTPKGEVIQETGIMPKVKTDSPLEEAHENWLETKYKTYKQWPSLENVQPAGSFTVTFPMNIKGISLLHKIELVELGGNTIPISVTQKNLRQLTIRSQTPLKSQGDYFLIIHPGWKMFDGKKSKDGNMVEVKIQ